MSKKRMKEACPRNLNSDPSWVSPAPGAEPRTEKMNLSVAGTHGPLGLVQVAKEVLPRGGSIAMGVPQNRWFILKNIMKMDDEQG